MFLLGFSEAIGVAIPLVAIFLELDAVIVAVGGVEVFSTPDEFEPGGAANGHALDFTVGDHRILRVAAPAAPNAIAAILLTLRDAAGVCPRCHFEWSESNPSGHLFRYLILGHGDTPPVVREIIRRHEPGPAKRPGIHVGG